MITVEEALRLVLDNAVQLSAVRVPVGEALYCSLAEDVTSDLDSPPWDKSMVDGYAIQSADLASGTAELEVLEEVVAGAVPTKTVARGSAIRIMTGAPIPDGADCVVMIERTTLVDNERVLIEDKPHKPGQNILPRGSSFRRGELIVPRGMPITPTHIGLLCEVGCAKPLVIPRPRVAILSTGNELVDASAIPKPGQIRNSNGPMLAALVTKAGATPVGLGVARDERDDLRGKIATGLESDVLVLSGGVSAGVLDLVPSVLAELGVEQVFHKVNLKPGKPLWFGVRKSGERHTLVFGLPGNPVSSLVGFTLFVHAAIFSQRGHGYREHTKLRARISEGEFRQRGDRVTYYPASTAAPVKGESLPRIKLLAWHGSADLRALADAQMLAIFPAGEKNYAPGDLVEIVPI